MTNEAVPCRPVTQGPRPHFFGYYDKCPWDRAGRYLLALEALEDARMPGPDDAALLGFVDLWDANRWIPLAETRAWNWQQGAMAQWLPGHDERILFNDRSKGRFVARILRRDGSKANELPRPMAHVSADGRWGLSINFARMASSRPVCGYAGVPDPCAGQSAPGQDGVYLVDLASGQDRLVLSLAEAAGLDPRPSMNEPGVVHFFNHVTFNSGARRFLAIHCWGMPGAKYESRALSADREGGRLHILADRAHISHYTWLDDERLLIWIARPGTKGGFELRQDRSGEGAPFATGVLTRDGHCSLGPGLASGWLLTDTYPDAERKQAVFLYEAASGRKVELGRFGQPEAFRGAVRCDHHPRWNRDGSQVCIDSAHSGTRQMYVLEVASIVTQPLPVT